MAERDAEELLHELEAPQSERRAAAASELMRVDTPEARAALAAALGDPDAEVRGSAAESLAMLGDVASLPRLVELLAAAPFSEVVRVAWAVELLAESADFSTAAAAFDALVALGSRSPEFAAQVALLLDGQPRPAVNPDPGERHRVEAGIRAAFDGVKLGGGVSLRQAQAADTWREGHSEAEWRALPQGEVTDDWSQVPEAELRRDCTAYLDEEGRRYYLPALMLWLLDNYDRDWLFSEDGADMALIGTMMAIAPGKEDRAGRWVAFNAHYTKPQREAIAAYLEALPRLVGLRHEDATRVERAMRDYWGRFLPRLP